MRQDQLLPVIRGLALGVTAFALMPTSASAQQIVTPQDPYTPAPRLAGDGVRLLYSRFDPNTGRFRLAEIRDDGLRDLRGVRSRGTPFDVDVGVNAQGRPVAVYSRCSIESRRIGDAGTCSIRVLDLTSLRESSANVRRARGESDRSPAIWRGRIAFARTHDKTAGRGIEIRAVTRDGVSRLVYREALRERRNSGIDGMDYRGTQITWLSRQITPDGCSGGANDPTGRTPLYYLRAANTQTHRVSKVAQACAGFAASTMSGPVLDRGGNLHYLRRVRKPQGLVTELVRFKRSRGTRTVTATLKQETTLLGWGPNQELWSGAPMTPDVTHTTLAPVRDA